MVIIPRKFVITGLFRLRVVTLQVSPMSTLVSPTDPVAQKYPSILPSYRTSLLGA